MGLPLKQLEAEALELSPHERAQLAHRLIVSLDDGVEDDPVEVERAWEDEIRRRLEEVDAGTAELIPAEEVFAELRSRTRR
jgi:putative addiction module component (TIGR02574 family)